MTQGNALKLKQGWERVKVFIGKDINLPIEEHYRSPTGVLYPPNNLPFEAFESVPAPATNERTMLYCCRLVCPRCRTGGSSRWEPLVYGTGRRFWHPATMEGPEEPCKAAAIWEVLRGGG